ncbi:MAG: hypothetical protein V9G24_12135 [Rhodoblastus sp.]
MRIETEDDAGRAEEDDVERLCATEIFETLDDAVAIGRQAQFETSEIVRKEARAENREGVARRRNRGGQRE